MTKTRSILIAVWTSALALLFFTLFFTPSVPGASAFETAALRNGLPPHAAGFAPFFKQLYELQTGSRKEAVTIIQLGDSHTAGGWFTNRLRELFQKSFGNGGRGMMPPGVPFKYYQPGQVRASAGDNWKVHNSFEKNSPGLYGLAGFRVASSAADARLTLECLDPQGFNAVELEVVNQPGGGSFTVLIDDRPFKSYSASAERLLVRRLKMDVPKGSKKLDIVLKGNGPVEFLAWTILNKSPGVIYESHGIVGATVRIMDRWDPNIVAWELAHRNPGLIVVEYGGNEGFNDDLNLEEYRRDYEENISFLQKYAPEASILIVGSSDGARLPKYCRDTIRPLGEFPCGPLTAWEGKNYQALLKAQDAPLCRWHAPPNLAAVREIQREFARKKGYPFWDWSSLMEGGCGIHDWVKKDPPLAADDHLHLQKRGYNLSAEELFKVIMDYYEQYRSAMSKRNSG